MGASSLDHDEELAPMGRSYMHVAARGNAIIRVSLARGSSS